MKFLNFLINSNIYVALGAVFLTLETQVQLGMQPQWHPYLFIIFFAALVDYNFHRLITVLTNREALNSEKHKWVRENLNLFYVLVFFSVLGFFIAISQAKRAVLITLAPIALITLFYTLPLFKRKKSKFRLRDIPGLKIFLIAFVWAAVTVFLPIIQTGLTYDTLHVGLMFTERFIFTFAITIPFDIRDMDADTSAGLKTIPLLIGVKNSLKLGIGALILFSGICVLHYLNTELGFLIPAFLISAWSAIYFLLSKKLRLLSLYHYGILDGTILLQGLLVCLCWAIK